MSQRAHLLKSACIHVLQIYKRSGIDGWRQAMQSKGPEFQDAVNWMSYQLAPRAVIFRRDAADITGLGSFKRIMRYNHFRHEQA